MKTFREFETLIDKKLIDTNIDNIYHLHHFFCNLYFSHLAYYDDIIVSDRLTKLGAINVIFYNNDGTQAYLAEFKSFSVVAFRGTEISKSVDIKAVLKLWKRHFGESTVHAGFVESLHDVGNAIMKDILNLPLDKNIYYTGHSMGGALATMLALMHKPNGLCTFGSPKIGGGIQFKKYFENVDYYRIVTKWDWVVLLPINLWPVLEYHHIGSVTKIPGPFNPFKSHSLSTYLASLKYLETPH